MKTFVRSFFALCAIVQSSSFSFVFCAAMALAKSAPAGAVSVSAKKGAPAHSAALVPSIEALSISTPAVVTHAAAAETKTPDYSSITLPWISRVLADSEIQKLLNKREKNSLVDEKPNLLCKDQAKLRSRFGLLVGETHPFLLRKPSDVVVCYFHRYLDMVATDMCADEPIKSLCVVYAFKNLLANIWDTGYLAQQNYVSKYLDYIYCKPDLAHADSKRELEVLCTTFQDHTAQVFARSSLMTWLFCGFEIVKLAIERDNMFVLDKFLAAAARDNVLPQALTEYHGDKGSFYTDDYEKMHYSSAYTLLQTAVYNDNKIALEKILSAALSAGLDIKKLLFTPVLVSAEYPEMKEFNLLQLAVYRGASHCVNPILVYAKRAGCLKDLAQAKACGKDIYAIAKERQAQLLSVEPTVEDAGDDGFALIHAGSLYKDIAVEIYAAVEECE